MENFKLLILFTLFSFSVAKAQQNISTDSQPHSHVDEFPFQMEFDQDSLKGFNDEAAWLQARQNYTETWQQKRFVAGLKRDYIDTKYNMRQQATPPTTQAACTNVGFETGNTSGWTLTKCHNDNSTTEAMSSCGTNSGDYAIVGAGFTDGNVSAIKGPSCLGGNVLRMGNMTTGGYAYVASQTFNVTPFNSVFSFCYAVVLEDGAHACNEQPYFDIKLLDCNNNPVPCSSFYSSAPGASCSSGDPSFVTSGAYQYLNWKTRAFDLTSLINSCVTIKVTVAGCVYTQGAHAGYCYFDASCSAMGLTLDSVPTPNNGSNAYFCSASTHTLCAPTGFTYNWTGPGVTGQTGQCVNVSAAGSYSVNLTIAGASCFNTNLWNNFVFTTAPTANFTYTIPACTPTFTVPFADASNTNGGAPIQSYTWKFGDGTTGTGATITHTYSPPPGAKTVTLVVSNGGCQDSITKTINLTGTPTASFTTANVCMGSPASFTSNSSPTPLAAINWTYGDGGTGSGTNSTHTYTNATTYNVKLVVTDPAGCKDSITQPITINPKPTVNFTTGPVCLGSATNFNNTTTISPAATVNYTWTFGDGGTSNTTSPTYNYSTPNTYSVTLVGDAGGCSGTITKTVTINPLPTIVFTAANACVGKNVSINNTSSISSGSIAQWSWSFGSGATPATSSNQTPPSLSYSSSGLQTITLTATSNNSCTATGTGTVFINPQPTAAFVASSVCQGIATTFTDQSTPTGSITAWQWDFIYSGSGPIGSDNTTQAPSYTYNPAGNYTAALIVTDANGCKDTITGPVTVFGQPVANFSVTPACYNDPNVFTDQSTSDPGNPITTYGWTFGDGGTSAISGPSHLYSSASPTSNSTFTAQLVVATANCRDSISKVVTVYSLPIANFTSDSVCMNTQTHLTDASSGNGNTITGYNWDFNGDNNPDQTGVANPNFTFPSCGNTLVNYTVSTSPAPGLSCKSYTSNNVYVHCIPVAAFTFTNVCINAQPLNLDGSGSSISAGSIATYSWSYGDNNSGLGSTTTHNYANASTYNVTLLVTSNKGCTNSVTHQVIVYEKPKVTFSSSKTCIGAVTSFTGNVLPGSGNVSTWNWDFNNSITTPEGHTPVTTYTFPAAGTQTINLVTITSPSEGSCSDTLTRVIYVNYVPAPDFTIDDPDGCPIHCVNFTDATPTIPTPGHIATWTWMYGDGTTTVANSNSGQQHCYNNTSSSQLAIYSVTLVTQTDSGCVASNVKNNLITVFPSPIANYDVSPNPGNVVLPLEYFTNHSQDYTQWWWTFGDGSPVDSLTQSPTHMYSDYNAADYHSMLVVKNQYGCYDTAQVLVEIGPEFTFYIPNCFTPGNEDGINDGFTGKGIGITKYEMWIFDRWGENIYYTDDIAKPWDGKRQGKSKEVQQDVYVWKVKLIDVFGKKHEYIGHVTVLR